jgi:hypothetical protein
MELSLLYLLDIGSVELPVDFRNNYRSSWLGTLKILLHFSYLFI